MKSLNILKLAIGITLAGLGLSMVASNPSQSDYEEYAGRQLSNYLKTNVCTEAPKGFNNFLERECKKLVDTGRPKLKRIIAENTYRHNFVFFSIYSTDLAVHPLLPGYHVETLGAFQNFYIYQAEAQ
ncbi:DUF4359 domain-containing protein [Aerosakkonema sp. BLCC-F183]|uniref:DUF4359 domain-containing protein n=1 Tax=Aerosakkonema sp. BLCC-F183 TaxID=3342834 RepID=UPI0035BB8B0A